MASAITLTARNIVVEDFLPGSTTFAQNTENVLGLGAVLVTPLVVAANDAAAAAASVPLGGVYVCNGGSFNYLRTRMT